MFQLLHSLLHLIQPLLVPVCFVLAWSMVALAFWSVFSATRDGVTVARRLHQIPCANCQFFTGDYHLKCTVHPAEALSEWAIDCPDFASRNR